MIWSVKLADHSLPCSTQVQNEAQSTLTCPMLQLGSWGQGQSYVLNFKSYIGRGYHTVKVKLSLCLTN
jgi:hypothetical protein